MAARTRRRTFSLLVLAVLVLGASTERCTPTGSTLYVLGARSSFEQGCFPPCLCPILLQDDLRGTFVLRPHPQATPSPFDTYQVDLVEWRVGRGEHERKITGSGIYEIGGEVALQQRLVLDLQVGSDPVQRFDSGLVVPPARFPRIAARVSTRGEWCYDTVLDLKAAPAMTF